MSFPAGGYGAPTFSVQYTDEAAGTNGVKVLAYGGSGVGKTRLALSCPHPLVLSAEGGILSLRAMRIPFIEITSIEQLTAVGAWLAAAGDQWLYQTIILDSISEIAETCLRAAKIAAGKDPRRAYGALIEEMLPLVRAFRDLRYRHVVVIAKEEWQKEDTTGAMMFYPSLPGAKLGGELPYFFDEVLRLMAWRDPSTKELLSAFQTFRDHQTVAKDRSGALAPYEAPNMGAIFSKITGR